MHYRLPKIKLLVSYPLSSVFSHVGDARHTSMGMARGKHNIGQLCRTAWGRDVLIIGCGTHTGTVAAAHNWGEPMEVMDVVPSLR